MLRVVSTANFTAPFDDGEKVTQNFKAPQFAKPIHSCSFKEQQPAPCQYSIGSNRHLVWCDILCRTLHSR